MRFAFVFSLAIAAGLLLTGCEQAPQRRELPEPAPTGPGAAPPPASTPDATAVASETPAPVVRGSAGCGTPVQAGSSIRSIESDGSQRSYRLYVPSGYVPGRPAALVLNYHGFGASALEQEQYSEYPAAADKHGFIVATPEGTSSPREWFLYGPVEQGYVDDFAFTGRLIDELSATLCIDERRIFATGLSNGGGMTSLAGCVLSDRIAAIAPVAGSPYAEARCRDAGPMPIIAFHGTEDPLVPFEAGPDVGRLDLFRFGARNNMRDWARHNGCNMTLKTDRVAPDVVVESYIGCRDNADVQLYVIEGGGHVWPGASRDLPAFGHTTQSISATELAWLFFAAHPKR